MRFKKVQNATHELMDKCFDKWAGLLIRFSKAVCLAFLIIYILIGKSLSFMNLSFRAKHKEVRRI